MSSAYWNQFSYLETMSMHGVEPDECDDDEEDEDCDSVEHDFNTNYCRGCSGGGCNHCLMCVY